jgi:hypothetical protein
MSLDVALHVAIYAFMQCSNRGLFVPTFPQQHHVACSLLFNAGPCYTIKLCFSCCAQVLADMHARPLNAMQPALVINLDVKDSHEEAALAAPHALELCSLVSCQMRPRKL